MVKKSWEKKVDNKGFTLVELIVVLVILAILAAILVPALLGYIDRAKGSQVLLNAKAVLTAAQAEASNAYATSKDKPSVELKKDARLDSIANTADVGGHFYFITGGNDEASPNTHDSWTITYLAYTSEDPAKDESPAVYFDYSTKSWVENSTWGVAKGAVDTAGSGGFGNGVGK